MGMKVLFVHICTAVVLLMAMPCVELRAQEQKEPDLIQMAEDEADRLQRVLDLDDWQVFYVDSTLKHNFPAMHEELMDLRNAKVSNASMYQSVQDKWMERTDSSYLRIFSESQWAAYLKSGAAKLQKARAKRRAKAEGKK